MLIDWFTVIAQMVNFLILIALLKRFLYKPLLGALDRREALIKQQLAEAARAKRAAREEARRLSAEHQDFAHQKEQLLSEARQAAADFKQQELLKISDQLEARRRQWQAAIDQEKQQFMSRLRRKIGQLVFSVSQKTLFDLAGKELEKRVLDFMVEKGEIPLAQPGEKVVIRSGFPIDDETRRSLVDRLGRRPDEVRFQEDETIGFGLTILVSDRKTEWNLAKYLEEMEDEVLSELENVTRGISHGR